MPPQAPLTSNMYYEHLPDTSWKLLAKFHRGKVPKKAVEDEQEQVEQRLAAALERLDG